MKNRFTIGQMSKLHNIPVKTLRYYDEIDLFKPIEVDPESGYRYYSTEQFKQLDIIHYLKTLGVPLKEIKEQLNSRNIHDFLNTLYKHREITIQKINELEQIKRRIEGRIEEIEYTFSIDKIGAPFIKHIDERTVVRLEGKIQTVYDLEIMLRKLKNKYEQLAPIFIGKVGLTLSPALVEAGQYQQYNSIFLILEDSDEKNIMHDVTSSFPAGNYACIYYRGTHSDSPMYIERLLQFIETEKLEISGEYIQRAIIDPFISRDKSAFLTEIQVFLK